MAKNPWAIKKIYIDILLQAIKHICFSKYGNIFAVEIYLQLTSQVQRSNHFNIERASRNPEGNTEDPKEKWAEYMNRLHPKRKINSPQK